MKKLNLLVTMFLLIGAGQLAAHGDEDHTIAKGGHGGGHHGGGHHGGHHGHHNHNNHHNHHGDWNGHHGDWNGHHGDWNGHHGDWNHGNWNHGDWNHGDWNGGGVGVYGNPLYSDPNVYYQAPSTVVVPTNGTQRVNTVVPSTNGQVIPVTETHLNNSQTPTNYHYTQPATK